MTVLTPEQALELPHAMAEATKHPQWKPLISSLTIPSFKRDFPDSAESLADDIGDVTRKAALDSSVVRVDPKVVDRLWCQCPEITMPSVDEAFAENMIFVFDDAIPAFDNARWFTGGPLLHRCVAVSVSSVVHSTRGEFSGWLVQLIANRDEVAESYETQFPDVTRSKQFVDLPKFIVFNFRIGLDGTLARLSFDQNPERFEESVAWSETEDGMVAWGEWINSVYELVATLMWWTNDKLVSGAQRLPRPQRRNVERKYGVKVGDIRYVALRRTLGATKRAEASGVAIDWSHRWPVRGHKRHLADGRVINVRPYVKGPADKPIIANQRLYEAKR